MMFCYIFVLLITNVFGINVFCILHVPRVFVCFQAGRTPYSHFRGPNLLHVCKFHQAYSHICWEAAILAKGYHICGVSSTDAAGVAILAMVMNAIVQDLGF